MDIPEIFPDVPEEPAKPDITATLRKKHEKEERAALKKWLRSGTGERPVTPVIDEMIMSGELVP